MDAPIGIEPVENECAFPQDWCKLYFDRRWRGWGPKRRMRTRHGGREPFGSSSLNGLSLVIKWMGVFLHVGDRRTGC